MSEARDKALHTIVKLRRLADHPNTPPAEAEAARSRIAALQAKHDISATEKTAPPRQESYDEAWRAQRQEWMRSEHARMAREYTAQRAAREEAERKRREDLKGTDAMGRRDPFADSRTHAERQRDLNNSFGKNGQWYNQTFRQPPMTDQDWVKNHRIQSCTTKASFFDEGGVKRRRNVYSTTCCKCGRTLLPNEGTTMGTGWVCCETVPGPRAKKAGHSD